MGLKTYTLNDSELVSLSSDEWREQQKQLLSDFDIIKIIGFDFSENESIDFSDFEFNHCSFHAAFFSNINFDRCRFDNCYFDSCEFYLSSFVDIVASNTSLSNCKLNKIVARNANIDALHLYSKTNVSDSTLKKISVNNSSVEQCTFLNNVISDLDLKKIYLRDNTISLSSYNNISISDVDSEKNTIASISYSSLRANQVLLDECSVSDLKISKVYFENSQISNTRFSFLSIISGSFSNGTLENIDLRELSIEKIGLLRTATVNCVWPEQEYTVTTFGKYKKAKHLLKQPVEDIIGISPKERNTIKTAQLVECTINNNNKTLTRIWLWFWGVTTEYGRSLTRLTAVCFCIILFLNAAFWWTNITFTKGEVSLVTQYSPIEIFKCIFWQFLGIDILSNAAYVWTIAQNSIFMLCRLMGYIFMGLWVGVAANRIGSIE